SRTSFVASSDFRWRQNLDRRVADDGIDLVDQGSAPSIHQVPEVPTYKDILAGGNCERHVKAIDGHGRGEYTSPYVLLGEVTRVLVYWENTKVSNRGQHALTERAVPRSTDLGEGQLRDCYIVAGEPFPELEGSPPPLGESLVHVGT